MSDVNPTADSPANPEPIADPALDPQPDPGPDPKPDPSPDPAPEPTDDWRASIEDEDLRKHAERFKDPTDAVRAHLDLRKKLSTAVSVPGKDAPEEELASFRKAMGVPDKPDVYFDGLMESLDTDEMDEEALAAAKEEFQDYAKIAHEHNIPKDAFLALARVDIQREMDKQKAQERADKEQADQTEAALKEKWGPAYDRELEYANRGTEWVFGDKVGEFREFKVGDKLLGDHPLIVEAMNKIGRAISEDVVPMIPTTPEEAGNLREELNKLTAEQDKAMREGDMDKARTIDRKIMEVSAKIGGDAPI